MDILYLLIPLSVILVFFILGGLWWAIDRGQFEDIESEGERILKDSLVAVDISQIDDGQDDGNLT
jgi:cbb3-type cytochrome oxidase maturation protein